MQSNKVLSDTALRICVFLVCAKYYEMGIIVLNISEKIQIAIGSETLKWWEFKRKSNWLIKDQIKQATKCKITC